MWQILYGHVFGFGSPAYAFGDVVPAAKNGGQAYYREGFLFTPGAEDFVYSPNFELPVQSMRGIPIAANLFNPLARQVYVLQSVPTSGLGGQQHGTVLLNPLSQNGEDDAES
jgi:hypothetical protein